MKNLIFLCLIYCSLFASDCPEPDYAHVQQYFNSIGESPDLEEMADFLVGLKADLLAQGHSLPSLSDLCIEARNYFLRCGIETDDEALEEIYIVFAESEKPKRDFDILLIKDKKKKEKKIEVSKNTATAAAEFIGGALLFLTPIPGAQVVGSGLIADAGRRAYNEVKDNQKDKKKEKKKDKPKKKN